MNERRFIVIGGGVSGMAAAIILAKRGCAVTLVERNRRLGATLRGFTRQGVHFDTGLHYAGGLHKHGALTRYLALLGIHDLPLVDFDGQCFDRLRFLQEGVEIDLPVGQENIVETLCRHFPRDRAFIAAYFKRMRDAFFSSTFLKLSGSPRDFLDEALQQESLASVVRTGTQSLLLRTVLSVHCLLYGGAPEETAFIHHAHVAGSYLEGVKTIAGGGQTLVQAFEGQLRELGVQVLCGVAAAALRCSGSSASELVLGDERCLQADGFIFTAHPALLPAMLPKGAVKPAFLHRLTSLEDTFSAYTLFGKSATPVPGLRGKNLFIFPTTDLSSVFSAPHPQQGPFYISACSVPAEKAGHANRAEQGILAFAPGSVQDVLPWAESRPHSRPAAYRRFKAERLGSIRKALLAHCGELASVDFVDGGTPLTNRDYLGSPGGGLYGAKHSLHQFSPLPITRIPNLWMAGQSVVAPGVLGAVISAFVACGFIFGMESIQKELGVCAQEG